MIGEDDARTFGWYMGMSGKSANTGKPFNLTIFERWVVEDGLLREVRPHYWDTKLLSDIHRP